jgi:RNA polymerase sigma-70 factor (ECF subfamily)
MEGYSVEETAAILDCAPGTVKSRCSRGRARLLPLLAGLGAGNPGTAPRVPSTSPGSDPSPGTGTHPHGEEVSSSDA